MESSFSHLQTILVENALLVGLGVILTLLIVTAVWFFMTSVKKSPVLENQARVNSATLDAAVPTEHVSTDENVETPVESDDSA